MMPPFRAKPVFFFDHKEAAGVLLSQLENFRNRPLRSDSHGIIW
jgi:hypothetical protein